MSTISTFHYPTCSIYLLCQLCHSLFRDPVRLHRCAHTFCQACYDQWKDINTSNEVKGAPSKQGRPLSRGISTQSKNIKKQLYAPCPTCCDIPVAVQRDLKAQNLINDLKGNCTSKDCPWKGTYEEYQVQHMNRCLWRDGGMEGVRRRLGVWTDQAEQGEQAKQNGKHRTGGTDDCSQNSPPSKTDQLENSQNGENNNNSAGNIPSWNQAHSQSQQINGYDDERSSQSMNRHSDNTVKLISTFDRTTLKGNTDSQSNEGQETNHSGVKRNNLAVNRLKPLNDKEIPQAFKQRQIPNILAEQASIDQGVIQRNIKVNDNQCDSS